MEGLSDDETKALKELAQNLMAMGRVRRFMTAGLLWSSAVLIAAFLIWDKASLLWSPHK